MDDVKKDPRPCGVYVKPAWRSMDSERPKAVDPEPQKASRNVWRRHALNAAQLVAEKQEAYGDSFSKSGKIFEILYPDGIPVSAFGDALTMIRVVDKMFRIATDKDALGESPWNDILGYALLAVERDSHRGAPDVKMSDEQHPDYYFDSPQAKADLEEYRSSNEYKDRCREESALKALAAREHLTDPDPRA